MRFRLALVFLGVLALGFGVSSWGDARTNLAVARHLLTVGRSADVVTQVHLHGYAKKNGDQRLQVDAVRVALPGGPGGGPADDSGPFDGIDPQTGPWTSGWTPLTGADEVDDLPFDAALENRWAPSRLVDGYPSPTPVRFVLEDGTAEVMAESDIRRWDGPQETAIAVVFVVAGVGFLLVAALLTRGDLRRRRRRRAGERARLERERRLRGPQDAVSATPQDAPPPAWERRRRGLYQGRHRTSPEPEP